MDTCVGMIDAADVACDPNPAVGMQRGHASHTVTPVPSDGMASHRTHTTMRALASACDATCDDDAWACDADADGGGEGEARHRRMAMNDVRLMRVPPVPDRLAEFERELDRRAPLPLPRPRPD